MPLQAFIQCPHLEKLESQGCVGLEVIMLWSDKLVELDLTDSKVQTVSSSSCMRESDQSVKVVKGRNVRSNDYFVCFNDAIMLVLLLTHMYSRSYYMTCTLSSSVLLRSAQRLRGVY